MYIYIYIYMYVYAYIYIYIERERERERSRSAPSGFGGLVRGHLPHEEFTRLAETRLTQNSLSYIHSLNYTKLA